MQQTEFDKTKEHLEWAFKGHEVTNFGHNVQGNQLYGIYFQRFVRDYELEKLNQLDIHVQHIQFGSDNQTIIVVCYERRRK